MDRNLQKWKTILEKEIVQDSITYNELYRILVEIKNENFDRESVYSMLTQMRSLDLSDRQDDLLLELMDVVSGFCSPNIRLWD